MKPTPALALLLVCAPCWSQPAPATAKPAPARVLQIEERVDRGEPNVRYTVVEDEGSKIDELRVRGQLTHVVVTPKVGLTKSYEIIMSRSGREPVDGTGGANSAAGKRVWNVLAF
ncbi:MAG: DUF2782 domain-containing protein [Rhizobiales bacterium]|nr:DUF2782 domain-containing protein [Rhizobacter sp.]